MAHVLAASLPPCISELHRGTFVIYIIIDISLCMFECSCAHVLVWFGNGCDCMRGYFGQHGSLA